MARDKSIQLRVAERELAAWKLAAIASGMTLSEWIRERCQGPRALPP